jgi:hypothetical protein
VIRALSDLQAITVRSKGQPAQCLFLASELRRYSIILRAYVRHKVNKSLKGSQWLQLRNRCIRMQDPRLLPKERQPGKLTVTEDEKKTEKENNNMTR